MILQAAGLALLAALSPTTLLVSAVYLGSARPRLVGAAYLAGAIIMSLVMGLVVIAILRNTGLQHHSQRAPRYGLRLGLGLLMLAAGAALARRKPKQPDPDNPKQGLVSRMIAPAPGSAFAVGLLLFAPGITIFIAAVQVIATANASIEPPGGHRRRRRDDAQGPRVAAPAGAHFRARRDDALPNGFQRLAACGGNKILIAVLLVGGLIVAINGAVGLASG